MGDVNSLILFMLSQIVWYLAERLYSVAYSGPVSFFKYQR